ncbi:cohesin subunit SA-1-like isoform X2 [Brachionus plicatilis]|uniref:Cohesin subunit SA-1-like isoform X2 n=1 Tax=Brachionus plicatilis TaxID=10195 RepID=A0A3M7RG08_BRAPC|nr:cohesin subunit SA-1-like isoform X2 [Brachionus plicatilis]
MIPLRERIVRKAKEKAVESLHELTTNQNNRSLNNKNNSTLNNSSPASTKRNNRSYKPFNDQNHLSEEDNSDVESHETPKKSSRGRRKPLQTTTMSSSKQSKVRKDTSHSDTTLDSDHSTNSIFDQVYSSQVSAQTIVDDWIELYKKERQTAMLDLIKFIVRSSGCKAGHLLTNKEILKSKEFAECINELIDHFADDDEPAELYPLVQTSVHARRFKSNFTEFLQLLINQCQYSIIYDQYMLDILITFLIALADSQVRAFRHTATLAVLKIMTALVDTLLALSIAKDANQRQYANEKQKAQPKRAQDRIELLVQKKNELAENEQEVENFINFIFKAVFIHRYRDVCADIRAVCINEIGEWMRKCADKFLDDTFLKYIGWTLYDKTSECRLKCLQALHPLYQDKNLVGKLELFTSRFKNRLVEMSLDREHEVSVAAIHLLTEITVQNDAALEDRDCENLYELVYHSNRSVAQAAGQFLNQKLFVKMDSRLVEMRRTTKHSANADFIQLLVQFLIESEIHDHATYLVDAMWDTHDMLKDWQCMSSLLLDEPAERQHALSDLHERYLVEIMSCCVRQAATGEQPVARRLPHKKPGAKELKQIGDDRAALTNHFIQHLPSLLDKFVADAEKLVHLLQIVGHFDLNQYTLRRQEKSLDRLLGLVRDIVNKHNDAQVLAECSLCLKYLCDEDQAVYSKCNVMRSAIMDDLVQKFSESMRAFEQLAEVDEAEMYPLILALKRLAAFAENHNIVHYDVIGDAFTILKWAVFNDGFSLDFVNTALNLARSFICWNLHKLQSDMDEEGAGCDQPLLDYVAKISRKFYKICNKLFVNDNASIEQEAYYEMCDWLLLFNVHLASRYNGALSSLVIHCSLNEINMLSVYVMNNVFTAEALDEKADTAQNIERLHTRRSVLAAFCKLIAYNCVPIKYAAEILRSYTKYSTVYGDIIKSLLAACRDISKVDTGRTIALALQREHMDVVASGQNSSGGGGGGEWAGLKELAKKLCLSLGPEAGVRSRDAIVAVHTEAIGYARESASSANQAPANLAFLEVIIDFSARLTSQDKKMVLAELDKAFAGRANKIEHNNWQPYYTYRLSLMDEVTAAALDTHLAEQENLTPSKLGRKRKLNGSGSVTLGVSRLRQSLNFERPKQTDKTIPEERGEQDGDGGGDADGDENREQNGHVDATVGDLEVLKLSSIEHVETGRRVTRSGKALVEKNVAKRSRSPLVSNNSINESVEQHSVLCSTRIVEPRSEFKKKLRSSIGVSTIGDLDEREIESPAKRGRKSHEMDETNENNNFVHA